MSKEGAERVARHLVMAGRLLDDDPELAYAHAQAAAREASRVDVVREAAGLTAYRTGRYGEALRELRTFRRLSGSSEHLPIMADCERGLGRPERALALAGTPEAESLSLDGQVELAIVISGARVDLGELDAAIAVLDEAARTPKLLSPQISRIMQAKAEVFAAQGETEAARLLAEEYGDGSFAEADEDIVVYDLTQDAEPADDLPPGEDGADEASEAEPAPDPASGTVTPSDEPMRDEVPEGADRERREHE